MRGRESPGRVIPGGVPAGTTAAAREPGRLGPASQAGGRLTLSIHPLRPGGRRVLRKALPGRHPQPVSTRTHRLGIRFWFRLWFQLWFRFWLGSGRGSRLSEVRPTPPQRGGLAIPWAARQPLPGLVT